MKRIFFTLIILFTMSANAQIADTGKVMNVHTKYDFVEEIEVPGIKQIDFYNDLMNVKNRNSFFIEANFLLAIYNKDCIGYTAFVVENIVDNMLKTF